MSFLEKALDAAFWKKPAKTRIQKARKPESQKARKPESQKASLKAVLYYNSRCALNLAPPLSSSMLLC
uniref:Uncharacterized protein n=1 Tax=viral metagenome TaxID=1070528 RepID=A0A6C0AN69_9ZZZZ